MLNAIAVASSVIFGITGIITAILAQRVAKEANRKAEDSNLIAQQANKIASDANALFHEQIASDRYEVAYRWQVKPNRARGTFTIVNNSSLTARNIAVRVVVEGYGVTGGREDYLPAGGEFVFECVPLRTQVEQEGGSFASVMFSEMFPPAFVDFLLEWDTPDGFRRAKRFEQEIKQDNILE